MVLKNILTFFIIPICLLLCVHLFRYEHLAKSCPGNCSYVWDRLRQRECISFFGKDIACSQDEIFNFIKPTTQKVAPTWAQALSENKSDPDYIEIFGIFFVGILGIVAIFKRETLRGYLQTKGCLFATRYYMLGLSGTIASFLLSGIPGLFSYLFYLWMICLVMNFFETKPTCAL